MLGLLHTASHLVALEVQNSEEDVASSLLGTPQLITQASNAARPPATTPRRPPPAPPQPQVCLA